MNLKLITRIGSLAVVFFFLPSIGIKIWRYLAYSPWPAKSWLVYLILASGLILIARRRLKKRLLQNKKPADDPSLLRIAKERLVKGEISLTEFKEIKQELK